MEKASMVVSNGYLGDSSDIGAKWGSVVVTNMPIGEGAIGVEFFGYGENASSLESICIFWGSVVSTSSTHPIALPPLTMSFGSDGTLGSEAEPNVPSFPLPLISDFKLIGPVVSKSFLGLILMHFSPLLFNQILIFARIDLKCSQIDVLSLDDHVGGGMGKFSTWCFV